MVRRRPRTTIRPNRRKVVWARDSQILTGVTNALPQAVNLLGPFETALGSQLLGSTVVRIRGVMAAVQTGAAANSVLRVGILTLPSNTAATAVNPFDEPHADYMLYEPFLANVAAQDFDQVNNRVIDNKSKRKLDEMDQELRLTTVALQGTWTLIYDLSILLALP